MIEDERFGLPSASNWYRYEICPGSYRMAKEAKRLGQEACVEASEEAKKGLRIHAALAGEKVELSESESETVEHLKALCDSEVRRIFGDAEIAVYREHRIWLRENE